MQGPHTTQTYFPVVGEGMKFIRDIAGLDRETYKIWVSKSSYAQGCTPYYPLQGWLFPPVPIL